MINEILYWRDLTSIWISILIENFFILLFCTIPDLNGTCPLYLMPRFVRNAWTNGLFDCCCQANTVWQSSALRCRYVPFKCESWCFHSSTLPCHLMWFHTMACHDVAVSHCLLTPSYQHSHLVSLLLFAHDCSFSLSHSVKLTKFLTHSFTHSFTNLVPFLSCRSHFFSHLSILSCVSSDNNRVVR